MLVSCKVYARWPASTAPNVLDLGPSHLLHSAITVVVSETPAFHELVLGESLSARSRGGTILREPIHCST